MSFQSSCRAGKIASQKSRTSKGGGGGGEEGGMSRLITRRKFLNDAITLRLDPRIFIR